MGKVVKAEIAGRIVLIAGFLASSLFNLGFYAILGFIILGTLVNFAFLWRFSGKFVKISLAHDFALWRKIFSRSWPIGVSIFFNLFYLHTGVIVLSLIKPATEVGLYGAAFRTLEVLLTIPMLFMGLILPLYVDAWERRDKAAFKEHLDRAIKFLSMIGIPFMVGAYFTATPVMKFIAGQNFAGSGPILQILSVAVCFVCFSSIFTHAVVAMHKQKIMLFGFFLAALTAGLSFFTLAPLYGGIGIAIGTASAELVTLIFSSILVTRTARFLPSFTILWKIIFSCALMAASLWFLQGQHALISVGSGIVIYALGLFLTRALTLGMVKEIASSPSPFPRRGQG
jgi:O-antigen/teichoic acid export membrane protein